MYISIYITRNVFETPSQFELCLNTSATVDKKYKTKSAEKAHKRVQEWLTDGHELDQGELNLREWDVLQEINR